MAEMFDLLCPGGRVALVGIPLEPFPFDVSKAQIKEARIENVFRYAHVYPARWPCSLPARSTSSL